MPMLTLAYWAFLVYLFVAIDFDFCRLVDCTSPKQAVIMPPGRAGLVAILSPAKTLDLAPLADLTVKGLPPMTKPSCEPSNTRLLAKAMKARNERALQKLLGVSAKLASTVHKYWSEFELDPEKRSLAEQKPAMFTFNGPAYQGLDAASCSEDAIRYLQTNLRIIDPLYGALRPLDLIQPYRLEMATKGVSTDIVAASSPSKNQLADWWKSSVTQSICRDLEGRRDGGMVVVNLASDEYSRAVDAALFPAGSRYVKVVFRQEGRVLSVHAKRARGLMARFLADGGVDDVEAMKLFALEGYKFDEGASGEDVLVFDRKKQPPPASQSKRKAAPTEPQDAPKVNGKRGRRGRK